jgi:hypothetical protein
MPEFTTEIDIYPREFVDSCSRREIKELIDSLIEEGHLPEQVLNHTADTKRGRLEGDFIEKLDQLKEKFYSLSSEEEGCLNQIFKKYL